MMGKKDLKSVLGETKEKKSVLTVALFIILIFYVASLAIPIIWAIYSSFNDVAAYRSFYVLKGEFPLKLTFDNFYAAFTEFTYTTSTTNVSYNFFEMFLHSVIYAVGSAAVFTITPMVVAYCAARFKFKFSKVIYAFVLITMALPIVGSMPSEMRMLKNLGIFDTFFGMWVLRTNFLSIYFLIFYAQFESIPMDYTEAAKVDGASNLRIMFTVVLPQAVPTIITVFLLSFIGFWNDYQIPRAYLPSYPTVSEGLFLLARTGLKQVNNDPTKLAGIIGMTLPLIVIFAILNKRLRFNVAAGGIKG